ncbi:MAG: glycosyltransferase family 4 protein [Lentisphaerota bacterium]
MTVFYILDSFPSLSENFILREMLALKKLGVNIRICALKKPSGGAVNPEALPLVKDVIYVNDLPFKCKFLAVTGNFFRHPALFATLASSLFHDIFFSFRFMCQRLRGTIQAMAIADFADAKPDHIHAHFAYVTTDVARILAKIIGCKWSVSAHAWDIFTQSHAITSRRIDGADKIFACSMHGKKALENLKLRNYKIYEHPISNTQFPISIGISFRKVLTWILDIPCSILDILRRNFYSPNSSDGQHQEERIVLMYHGVDTVEFETSGRSDHIIAVGRLEEKKGFEILLLACKSLAEQNIRPRFIIVGEGPRRKILEAEIKKSGLENVELWGAMDFDKVKMLMAESLMLVHPGRITENGDHDGIPNVILEAMALAKPVIASSVGGISELIENGVNGLLVKPDDPEQLAGSIKALLTDKVRAEMIGKAAKGHIIRHFEISETIHPLFKYFLSR